MTSDILLQFSNINLPLLLLPLFFSIFLLFPLEETHFIMSYFFDWFTNKSFGKKKIIEKLIITFIRLFNTILFLGLTLEELGIHTGLQPVNRILFNISVWLLIGVWQYTKIKKVKISAIIEIYYISVPIFIFILFLTYALSFYSVI